jgi:hypothetical protein
MLGRALLITFQQALRSVVLTLFPLGFISLITWATAGSTTGNTSDPIRAALWIWLAADLIPFKLTFSLHPGYGALTYLPIAAALLPFLAIRSGFKRSVNYLGNPRTARTLIVFWSILFATAAAALSQTPTIKPMLLLTPVYAGLLALLATTDFNFPVLVKTKFIWQLFGILFGASLLIISFAMAIHFKVMHELAIVIQPGWVGGILFLLIQILYLPNFAFATISYLFGLGFTIGAATKISPLYFNLNSLPAVPALSSLPTGPHPLILTSLLALAILLLLHQREAIRGVPNTITRSKILISKVLPVTLILTGFSYLAGGELITNNLKPVGITWWSLPVIFLAAEIVVAILTLYLPALLALIFRKKNNA